MENPKAKILVVDDEPSVLMTVQAILQAEGYDVDASGDPEAALGMIRTRCYDLVLTDLKMPKVDGLAILTEVRKASPNTVTVMMTGYASVDTALEAVQLGAYEYLLKPTDVPDLKLAVKRSLERKRLSETDTLYNISRTIGGLRDVGELAEEVSDAARRVLKVESASVVWPEEVSDSPCDYAVSELLQDAETMARFEREEIVTSANASAATKRWAQRNGIASYALVPGNSGGRLICVLAAHNGLHGYEFHASSQRFLCSLASQAALALNNAALITELRRNNRELESANEKLRELDRLKSQFLNIATHELRTPLTIMLGYNAMLAESLGDRLTLDERESLRESASACKRLIRLVNSMLDVSQIESGRMPMNFATTDVRQLVSSVVTLFRTEARNKGVHLGVQVPSRLPKAFVDGERVQQVLTNLIGNALKFTPKGGTIQVGLRHRAEPQQLEIAVSDTGIGIAEQDQSMIFEEFAQVRRTPADEGAGLGLAISRRIVRAHGGDLLVRSEPGKGSTFVFTVPVQQPAGIGTAVSA